MVQASLFAVVVVPLVVAPLVAATGFAIWLEPFVEVQENKDENIVYIFVDTYTIYSGVYYIHFYGLRI
jgi:hypothetical protein